MSQKIDTFRFALINIKTEQFSTKEELFPASLEKIAINNSFGFTVVDPNNLKIIGRFELFDDDKKESPFIIIEIASIFQIIEEDFDKLLVEEGISIPQNFALHLASVVLGIARGALHAYTENTIFNRTYIPLIDLSEIIDGDIVVTKDAN